jgi:4-hydroxybutyrate dehydrogenase
VISTFSFPTTIVFGTGAISELPARLAQLGAKRPLLVTDSGLAEAEPFKAVARLLGNACEIFSKVTANPAEADVEAAVAAYIAGKCDSVVAVGGGSALDVGKAIRLRIRRPEKRLSEFEYEFSWKPLAPFVAIPTTAGTGSEVGRSSVIIFNGKKNVLFHPSLLADLVILDPKLTVGLPPGLTAATGADALTHCIEAATSPVFHPLCDAIALEGIRIISVNLPRAVKNGSDLEARGQMLMAAMMGGIAFQKDLGATHSLAHPLSSIAGLHHGTANALCLPTVMKFNAQRKPSVYQRIGEAMKVAGGDVEVIQAIESLLRDIGLTPGLRARGVQESQLNELTDQAFQDGCHQTNPVPVTREDLYKMYQQAM